jgi:oligoribonuclease
MPNLYKFLHYRIVDVSTIKEICKRWIPSLPPFQKKECHRAMDDIRESIEELKFYKTHVFGFAITHYE